MLFYLKKQLIGITQVKLGCCPINPEVSMACTNFEAVASNENVVVRRILGCILPIQWELLALSQ
jgi:hypothetical protein